MLEGSSQLSAVIGQSFLLPLDFMLLIFGFTIKPTQDVLDTRYQPGGEAFLGLIKLLDDAVVAIHGRGSDSIFGRERLPFEKMKLLRTRGQGFKYTWSRRHTASI